MIQFRNGTNRKNYNKKYDKIFEKTKLSAPVVSTALA